MERNAKSVNLDFEQSRWEKIRKDAARWWAGELERPLLYITRKDRNPGRPEPALPWRKYLPAYDFSISAEEIVDRLEYELCRFHFYGDAYPQLRPNFGAGVIAAFLGGRLENRDETVWFFPRDESEVKNIRFRFNPENIWFRRVKEIFHAAMERWGGMVQLAMTDLGGNLDIVSSFRPGAKLLLDLYDHPDEIKRLTWEAHDAWWQYFYEFDSILRPLNPGYDAWTPIFSETPYYMLQCDFCYMISPEMFEEFVKPELAASCRKLAHPFYHLDGQGQLVHLDSLLSIPELRGVQWIPGEGSPDIRHWPEVFRKIRQAGKLIQFFGDVDDLDVIVEQLGSPKGILLISWETEKPEGEIRKALRKYGAE